MNAIRLSRILALASAVALAALATSAAHADILAATCLPDASGHQDIAILNAATGAALSLRAGGNGTDFESNPTISTDGRRLAFCRANENAQRLPSLNGYDGQVDDIATGAGGHLFALHLARFLDDHWLALVQRDGSSSLPLRMSERTFSQPALAAVNPDRVLFVQRLRNTGSGTNVYLDRDIAFRPATLAGFPGKPTVLRLGVSIRGRDESQPALTADGRYVGFVRDAEGGDDRLFVWDSQTQSFLNPNGIDPGQIGTATRCGSLSLYTRPVIASSVILGSGFVNASLVQASSIGIFVQRIVGKTQVLERNEYSSRRSGACRSAHSARGTS